MKEYRVFKLSVREEDTEKELNELAKEGWRLVCSYAWHNSWLVMERDKKVPTTNPIMKKNKRNNPPLF